ncbi:hypothetical protein CDS [Bradyrhizobium sp.]|nr:hypothetical protein CDS [Bradyrhizobium sp.]
MGLHPSRRRYAPPQDEVRDPHGEERGNAARLEPRGPGSSSHQSFGRSLSTSASLGR